MNSQGEAAASAWSRGRGRLCSVQVGRSRGDPALGRGGEGVGA